MDLSIIIPVYNSENIIEELVKQLNDSVSNISYINSFEIIMINDFSSDKSWEKIKSISKKFEFIKGISFAQNYGQHNAIMVGLEACDGEKVITMDDDLQHSPSSIVDLLNELNKGFDVCYTKYQNRKDPLWKKIGSWVNNLVVCVLLKKPYDVYLSPFKAFTKKMAIKMVKYNGTNVYIDGLILNITKNISIISVEHNKRFYGSSNFTLTKSILIFFRYFSAIIKLAMFNIIGRKSVRVNQNAQNIISETTFNNKK